MENLISASTCFDKATDIILKERRNKVFIGFDSIDKAIRYINAEVAKASSKGKMMIILPLFVKGTDHYKLYDLLEEAGYKVYPGLAGELYAISWEVGTSWKNYFCK